MKDTSTNRKRLRRSAAVPILESGKIITLLVAKEWLALAKPGMTENGRRIVEWLIKQVEASDGPE